MFSVLTRTILAPHPVCSNTPDFPRWGLQGMSASSATCGLFPVMAMARSQPWVACLRSLQAQHAEPPGSVVQVNHSCDPSLEFSARDGGRYVRAFATRAVKQGEELAMSYLTEAELAKGVEERQELLFEGFGFACVCRRCLVEAMQLDAEQDSDGDGGEGEEGEDGEGEEDEEDEEDEDSAGKRGKRRRVEG